MASFIGHRFFNADVWDHLATDLGEAAQPVGNADEALGVNLSDVAGHIPAAAYHAGGQPWLAEIQDSDN